MLVLLVLEGGRLWENASEYFRNEISPHTKNKTKHSRQSCCILEHVQIMAVNLQMKVGVYVVCYL